MHQNLNTKLLYRELYGNAGAGSLASIYGSKEFVDNLDIVDELHGHRGCVNALCWSRSGNLLATGSDDTRINIHTTTTPGYHLNTQIDTGHTANIFSVKFMPNTSDRVIVSAAGDNEVRIFDIDYAPTSSVSNSSRSSRPPISNTSETTRTLRNGRFGRLSGPFVYDPQPLKLVSHYETSPKVYRSHTDRVKRIVTEASPFLFLTCSEDGTVRQFDLRQPSEYYSRPRRGSVSGRRSYFGVALSSLDSGEEEDERNPPLISYRRQRIELKTMSCSVSQPWYIALGGSHYHCFLHDRRMLGRDTSAEAGRPVGSSSSEHELSAATRCVRRFAPRQSTNGARRRNSHITACKISDAYPNELVVSWSGDGAYLFNINYSPEPNEPGIGREPWDPSRRNRRVRKNRSRKGKGKEPKRRRVDSSASSDLVPGSSMIKLSSLVVELRMELFSLSSSSLYDPTMSETEIAAEKKKSYDAALALAATSFKRANRAIRKLDEKDLEFFDSNEGALNTSDLLRKRNIRATLARNRRRVRGFIKAAGCLARALGGFVEGAAGNVMGTFGIVQTDGIGGMGFRYKFLSVVVAFLDGGPEGVEQFAREEQELSDSEEEGGVEFDLVRFLRDLERTAGSDPVIDVNENEEIFSSEQAMVRAFRAMIEGEISNREEGRERSARLLENRRTARKFWGEKVGRAVLMKEGEGINFQFVHDAFGGYHDEVAENEEDEETSDRRMVREFLEMDPYPLTDVSDDYGDDDDDGDAEEDVGEGSNQFGWSSSDEYNEDEGDEESDEEGEWGFPERRLARTEVEAQAPIYEHMKVYRGHCNVKTIKDINFFGLDDEYVVSGSDCGNFFIWDKKTTQIVNILAGDHDTVNVVTGHPFEPTLAVSGIDNTVKVFSPDNAAQDEFLRANHPESEAGSSRYHEKLQPWKRKGSRRRMQDSYTITSQNEAMTESGLQEAVITVGVLDPVAVGFGEWLAMFS
ncbi:hypothetical protein RUND412_010727 [Rhizina undulata]